MFNKIETAPPDPIFSLMHEYNQDQRPDKINLTVGVFQDESGHTPVLECIKEAGRRLLESERSKTYLGINGSQEFNELNRELVLGKSCPAIAQNRAATLQTPGGTGALRIVGDFISESCSGSTIWCTIPTWANHLATFDAADVAVKQFQYLNDTCTRIDFEKTIEQIDLMSPRDFVLFHACCHNPSGFDPDRDQWEQLLQLVKERDLIPFFDCAYHGFYKGLDDDVWPIRRAVELGSTVFICNSYSKNMGLYAERTGGLTIVADDESTCQAIVSQFKAHARTIYSNPPKHGAMLAAIVLGDDSLRSHWVTEVDAMRNRLIDLRRQFVDRLKTIAPDSDFSHIALQNGMFSFSGLLPEQTEILKRDYGIYMLKNGRINIAGINQNNIDRLCEAIAQVTSVTMSK